MIVKLKELLRSNCLDDLRDKVSRLRTELHDILVTAKVASAQETADEICQYLDEHWLNDTFAGAEICNNSAFLFGRALQLSHAKLLLSGNAESWADFAFAGRAPDLKTNNIVGK